MKKITVLILLTANSLISTAPVISQDVSRAKEYPQGYFRNPLAIPIQLAANFGELRTNHYHMGLDIRTNQRENLPVYAAAEGYISRIKIERFGFGRAIYINHPNGYTTLYAHLNDFYPELNNYVKQKQYTDQKWEQEIELQPNEFPVTKGQFIAYSGNTGGSQGPHLHFEIRDTKTGNNLNPWLFGFNLADNIKPFIYKLYYFDRRYSTYQTGPSIIPIKGGNGTYTTVNNIVNLPTPYLSFGISTEDKSNISFLCGVYQASITVDSVLKSSFRLDDISYNDTRYINGSIDYKTRLSGGSYIQHLSRLPGNYSTVFNESGNENGIVSITDTAVHNAEIEVKDANGNTTTLKFKFRWDPAKTKDLMFTANTFPMVPGKENGLKLDDIELQFSAKAFYDTVPFSYRSQVSANKRIVSAVHYIHDYKVPVHDSFTVRIKPIVPITDELKNRTVMQLVTKREVEAVKGNWVSDFMETKWRDLGIVQLVVDTIAPRVTLSGWVNGGKLTGRRSIALVATDDVGEIKSFNAYLDGKWLLFSRRRDYYIHDFDEMTSPGRHELKVLVEDMAGNIAERSYTFTR